MSQRTHGSLPAHGPTTAAAAAAERPLVLALDIGSSSARALLYDRRGRALGGYGAQEPYALRASPAGVSEDDPDAAIERAARCVDGLLAQAGGLAAQIAGVAVATMAATFVALDGAGRPITPLITYADTRNAADGEALRRELDEAAVQDRTGCPLRTSYWPARLAWLRRSRPDLWQAAARFVSLGEYLELRLFGRCRASYSAAAWSGLLDRRRLQWDGPLLAHLGVAADRLSALADVDEPLAGLGPPFAARWPALRAAPWFPAIGDGAAANVGSGCTGHSRVALTVGTTGAMRAVQREIAAVPPGLWCYRVDRDHALVGGATSEGGNLYAWLRQISRLGPPDAVEAGLAAFPPDGHGLTVLPFVAGERSPGWAGDAQATIHGLTLATTPLAILRASLEAVAYRFALIEQRLCGRGDCDHRLVASGSALRRSPAWAQIFADVLGRPVVVSAEPEATSRGAALLALRSLGALAALDQAPAADGPLYPPDPGRQATYQAAMARQRWLYERLIGPHI